jgi:hypothetical protein
LVVGQDPLEPRLDTHELNKIAVNARQTMTIIGFIILYFGIKSKVFSYFLLNSIFGKV